MGRPLGTDLRRESAERRELAVGERSSELGTVCEPIQIKLGSPEAETMSGAGQHHGEMRVTVLKEIPEDLTLARDWNRLVKRMEHPEVFFTYEWALAAARAFQATLTPLLFLMYEADELCGVAPM